MASLFSDFLTALGVKHTEEYSDRRFREMPFQSMFGLANLLNEYGVGTAGVNATTDEAKRAFLSTFDAPYLIDTNKGFAIVTGICNGNVTYQSQRKSFTADVNDILDGWNGVALLATVDTDSAEPDYCRHHIGELANGAKHILLYTLVVVLILFGMWQSGLYTDWTAWLLMLFNGGGIWLSWMLVQKSMGIHNTAAEAVCGVLEQGGCDEIASSEAASFMGIFKWSEVGLTYFSISLLTMLLMPQLLPELAAINILCLPYTVWSITYQKFVAKTWCTLCVFVQATLWLLFFTYLLEGATGDIFPLTWVFALRFIALGCVYIATLLAINKLDDALFKYLKNESTQTT